MGTDDGATTPHVALRRLCWSVFAAWCTLTALPLSAAFDRSVPSLQLLAGGLLTGCSLLCVLTPARRHGGDDPSGPVAPSLLAWWAGGAALAALAALSLAV